MELFSRFPLKKNAQAEAKDEAKVKAKADAKSKREEGRLQAAKSLRKMKKFGYK